MMFIKSRSARKFKNSDLSRDLTGNFSGDFSGNPSDNLSRSLFSRFFGSTLFIGSTLFSLNALASSPSTSLPISNANSAEPTEAAKAPALTPVLADIALLEKIGVEILARHEETKVAYARLTPAQSEELTHLAHDYGKCGGFEALPYSAGLEPLNPVLTHVFGQLSEREAANRRFRPSSRFFSSMQERKEIHDALEDVSESNLRETVTQLSAYKTRFHRDAQPNLAGEALKKKIEAAVEGSSLKVQVDFVSHSSTPQKTIRARIEGSQRPNEIIVLGAHLDSVNQSWMGDKSAPGADDNASGSANLLEALRILAKQSRPERTIEIYWYAGEEGGLLGSAEIARQYKSEGKDVVGVLQLDMTLFPGDGEFTLGSMTDFTSAWLRSYFEELNRLYIKAKIVNDSCGYGCSDHASWHRQGYPALMPFEASFDRMNHNLHTSRDVIDNRLSFKHSAMFTKVALAMALDLGNSTLREPR